MPFQFIRKNSYHTMKAIKLVTLIAIHSLCYSQNPDSSYTNNISIDTLTFTYNIFGIDSITSYVPQLKSRFNTTVINNINRDIKSHFLISGITKDSAEYIEELLESNAVSSIKEYNELKAQEQKDGFSDTEEEYFEIEYFGESFLNIGYYYQVLPYRGQYQFFFTSLIYDLRKGNKLKFPDFFSINAQQLTALLESDGHFIYSDGENSPVKEKVDFGDNTIGEHIQYLFNDSTDENCTDFYFREIEKEIYLCFKLKCTGPQLIDCGIELKKLKLYVILPEFKNLLKLWGNDVHSLVGSNIINANNYINFQNYTITLGGGYMIDDKEKKYTSRYGIWNAHSDSSWFYFLVQHSNDNQSAVVLDVLEIKKEDMNSKKWIESYCYTDTFDPEIIALVKTNNRDQEYYYNIVKAWKANRETGKFELINKKRIKKCLNESYESDND